MHVQPPADYSGTLPMTIEAVAVGTNLVRATTGEIATSIDVDPVADGVAITVAPVSGVEDVPVVLTVGLAERDVDGSETIGSFTYVRLNNGATLVGGYAVVAGGDSDATIDGTSLVGFYRVPTASVASLQVRGAPNWHGTVTAEIAAFATDNTTPSDPTPDADNVQLDVHTVSINIVADADVPTVPASIPSATGAEDFATGIALSGLSASLNDLVTANGGEILSVVISGAPFGTRFSAGFEQRRQ